ncbi:M23 family metallopeptidase [Flavobacterium sp.]|uniref:M23 family metallopeptidase n=1 Tax=Flavobacterium sp. TaxID=239 RepID=UPI0026284384|nr:M23 family metallopeptidase [Flavobacterium sp.]MDD3004502.1 M23 family metallopeptidase [Flavobacterium sp.]
MFIRLLLLLISCSVFAQEEFPKNYFKSPLDIQLHLSGSFGELRNNHFHSGLDFKTSQKEGLNVYASADGYVSRIKISTYGYGKVIYITHPNGYTTVYGHLQKATGKIQEYIINAHYKEKSFEMELFLRPDELIVKQGDLIAMSGNSGGSGGPHLHFEIRNTLTEKTINPLFFGFDALIKDTKTPVVNTLMAYPIGENSVVNRSQEPLTINFTKQPDGTYLADKVLVNGAVGFGINAYDMFDFNYNKNGTYQVQSFLNGASSFNCQFNVFAFDESRYINAFLDYPRYKKTGVRIQQLFMENPYSLSIIQADNSNGIVHVKPNINNTYRIEVKDFHNNKVIINIPIQYSSIASEIPSKIQKTPYYLIAKNDNMYKKDNISVFVEEGTFYDDFYLNFDVKEDTLTFHDASVAVHKNFKVSIENNTLTEEQIQKTFIASVDGKRKSYNNTKFKSGTFTTYTKNTGKFFLAQDTIAPRIKPINLAEGKWTNSQKSIDFIISDDFSGIKTYNGYINGNWILFDYDYKKQLITYEFDEQFIQSGRNEFKLEVTDNVGNSTIFETHFFRSIK